MKPSASAESLILSYHTPHVPIERGRYDFILRHCAGKTVLHLGCVDQGYLEARVKNGTLLHTEIEKVAREITGVDASATGVTLLREYTKGEVFVGNVERLDSISELTGRTFDVIVATELIEHVDNAGAFLDSVHPFFRPDSILVLTTPNAFRLNTIPYLLRGYENVHPDHNYWFSWKTLNTLLDKHEYKILEEAVYSYGVFNLKSFRRDVVSLFGRLIGKSIPAYQEDECTRSISHRLADLIGSPVRRALFNRNSFFAEGLMVVIRPKY